MKDDRAAATPSHEDASRISVNVDALRALVEMAAARVQRLDDPVFEAIAQVYETNDRVPADLHARWINDHRSDFTEWSVCGPKVRLSLGTSFVTLMDSPTAAKFSRNVHVTYATSSSQGQ